jgi:putative endonuclease
LETPKTPYFVYIVKSTSTQKRYIGHTNDLNRRLQEHNNPEHNQAKFTTKQAGPWEFIHHETFNSRSEAMIREQWLKSRSGRRWIDDKFGRTSPAVLPD